jgi:hypothetical protein
MVFLLKKFFRTDKCVFIGNGKPFTIDNETMHLLSDLDSNKLPFNPEAHRFKKGIIEKNIYSTSNYKPLSQKQNCYVKTRNGEILKIIEKCGGRKLCELWNDGYFYWNSIST